MNNFRFFKPSNDSLSPKGYLETVAIPSLENVVDKLQHLATIKPDNKDNKQALDLVSKTVDDMNRILSNELDQKAQVSSQPNL